MSFFQDYYDSKRRPDDCQRCSALGYVWKSHGDSDTVYSVACEECFGVGQKVAVKKKKKPKKKATHPLLMRFI